MSVINVFPLLHSGVAARKMVLFFVLFLSGAFQLLYAQSSNPYKSISIVSPTSASLGKFGDIPVNNHTGIPNISIPVYTVAEGPLKLPISLDYHASGLKVLEQSSWVGAGWALVAGGVITRTLRSASDERRVSRFDQDYGHYSNYGYNNYLYKPIDANTEGQDWSEFVAGRKDGEPDLFLFNFNGFSGTFYFREDRTPVLVPQQDIRIEVNYPSDTENFQSWIITTPDGTKYYFGENNAREVTKPYTDGDINGKKVISSWYLTKIESADSNWSILLQYVPEQYSFYTLSMFPVMPNSSNAEYKLIRNYIDGVRLSSISYSGSTITFHPGQVREDLASYTEYPVGNIEYPNVQAKALDRIEIEDQGSGLCKKVKFSYSYFVDNSTSLKGQLAQYNSFQTDRKRLKLDALQELSCDESTEKPPYIFTYFEPEAVPRKLTFAQDHWGYFNGATGNTKLIPTVWINYWSMPGADRDARWPEMRAGTLRKISYPTGGYTEFEYAHHDTWVEYSQNELDENIFQDDNPATPSQLAIGYDGNTSISYNYEVPANDIYIASLSVSPSGACGSIRSATFNMGGTYYSVEIPANSEQGFGKSLYVQLQAGLKNFSVTVNKGGCSTSFVASMTVYSTTTVAYAENRTVGGLRIETITKHDGVSPNNDMVTNYGYSHPNGRSTGVLYSRPVYAGQIRNDMVKNYLFPANSPDDLMICGVDLNSSLSANPLVAFSNIIGVFQFPDDPQDGPPYNCVSREGCLLNQSLPNYYVSPSSIHPMQTTQGNHIGYYEVKVDNGDRGYSVYQYNASEDPTVNRDDVAFRRINSTKVCDSETPNFPPAPVQHDFERGTLSVETHYSKDDIPLEESVYLNDYEFDDIGVAGLITEVLQFSPSSYLLGTQYTLKTAWKTRSFVQTKKYDQQGVKSVTTTTEHFFDSPYHYQPTEVKSSVNDGYMTSKHTYPKDYRIQACDNITTCNAGFQAAMTLANEQWEATSWSCGFNCIDEAAQEYLKGISDARINYQTCLQAYNPAFLSCLDNAYNNADSELKAILDMQFTNQAVPVEVSNWRNGKFLESTFVKFKDFENDRKSIYPEQVLKLYPTPQTIFTPSGNSDTQITKDTEYKIEEQYLHDGKGNLIQREGKQGIKTTYLWGYNGRYPVAQLINASMAQVEAVLGSNFSLLGAGGNVLSATQIQALKDQLPASRLATYTYDPLLGMTSMTDANNMITYYEYDELGRLKWILDNDQNILSRYDYHYKNNDDH